MSSQESRHSRAQPGPSNSQRKSSTGDWAPTSSSRGPTSTPHQQHQPARRQSSNDSACSSQATPEHYDLSCKVMLLGDSGVGKTCILTKFRDGQFLSGNHITTVGIDFRNKIITVDDSQVKLQIWDTAGQERFRSVTHAYYRDANALLLLYDVTNKQSFDNIRAWLGEIREYAQDDVVIMLLGNKCDCSSDRIVKKEDGQRLANEYKVPFMETSAKTGLNVDLAFHAVARELKARAKKEDGDQDDARFNVQDYLRQNQSQQRSSCLSTNCLTT
ncbi:ras-related protein Rab-37-like isoform X2 [Copidosoma floridanum]|uniref:ras-related protein Rab-37-like isoform X2 n=1 Tax=Copidosoma floridanum TaxID=29053 RepID=UPI0006C97BD3|nr:ras-related protein Rab-37-like isoform X2 [Copidosoma floridanum]XP_014206125.1 ras-related protein Rab-37-like isoform X2 [Copidosoma floridanum]XP_014206127.1 ras-related protein Rab-37-like isoform X2 [Copidosoma floridanum]